MAKGKTLAEVYINADAPKPPALVRQNEELAKRVVSRLTASKGEPEKRGRVARKVK